MRKHKEKQDKHVVTASDSLSRLDGFAGAIVRCYTKEQIFAHQNDPGGHEPHEMLHNKGFSRKHCLASSLAHIRGGLGQFLLL